MSDYHRQAAAYLPSYGTIFEPVVTLYKAWLRRRRFAQLRDLDDRQLDDIGVSRYDVEWGMWLPVRENAAYRVRCEAAATRGGAAS